MKARLIFILFISILFSCNKTPQLQETNSYYDKAYSFLEQHKEDSAFIYFSKAKDIFETNNNRLKQGKCLINMAIISTTKGDYYNGQTLSLQAKNFLNENDEKQFSDICSNYNNLGIASNNLKDYKNSIKFYDLAIKFADTEINKLTYLKNKANIYKEIKNYSASINLYESLILQVKNMDTKIYARLLSNLANVKWLQNHNYPAEKELLKSYEIEEKINDVVGLIANNSHLADYYTNLDNKKAILHTQQKIILSEKVQNPDDKLEGLQKLILLDPTNYSKNFKEYIILKDSIENVRNKTKNQFALIRFDAEKLKTENVQKENQILLQNIGIASLILLLISGTISGSIWIKRRKERLQKENELKIKENELKISKKVHDVVANGIYQVMTKIENQEHFDKDKALDELEFVYEKSRDISYEKIDSNDTLEFYKKISNLIGSFKNEKVNTFLAGNGANIWMDLSHSVQDEVYQIMRELLVNMKKHSQANLVAFKFERNNNLIQIQYTDNGIGIPGEIIHGNGLANTVSRIEKIKGSIIFDNTIEKGLKVYISFPIS